MIEIDAIIINIADMGIININKTDKSPYKFNYLTID